MEIIKGDGYQQLPVSGLITVKSLETKHCRGFGKVPRYSGVPGVREPLQVLRSGMFPNKTNVHRGLLNQDTE